MLEKKGIKEKIKDYIKQNIIMAVLKKARFHLVDICRLIKNQSRKKDQGDKLIFSKLPKLLISV